MTTNTLIVRSNHIYSLRLGSLGRDITLYNLQLQYSSCITLVAIRFVGELLPYNHWRVESGEWRVESGEWRVESGEWRNRGSIIVQGGPK